MSTNSKNKGNTFERKIANALCERFAAYTGIEKSFRRNPDSGSFFGGGNKSRAETHDTDKASFGDIIAPKDFKFTIECKHYKTAPAMAAMIKQEYAIYDKWIEQAENDASKGDTDMLLIVKFNNVPEFVIVDKKFSHLPNFGVYKGYVLVALEEILKEQDDFFFSAE